MHWRIHIFAIFATTNHPQTMSKQKRNSSKGETNNDFLQNPMSLILSTLSTFSFLGPTTLPYLYTTIAVIGPILLGTWGYVKYLDTMFTSHISIWYVLLFILGAATIGALFANKFKWSKLFEPQKICEPTYCYSSWLLFMLFLTSLSFFIIFKGNDLGGGEPQQIQARIVNIRIFRPARSHTDRMDLDIEFDMQPYHWKETAGLGRRFEIGQKCIVTYHKGLFGWNVFDSVEQAY